MLAFHFTYNTDYFKQDLSYSLTVDINIKVIKTLTVCSTYSHRSVLNWDMPIRVFFSSAI